MSIIIGSSFGNMGVFVLAIPVLLLAFLCGGIAALFRLRWLSILTGAFCVFTGIAIIWYEASLPHIPGDDDPAKHWTVTERIQERAELLFFGKGAICLGLVLSAGALLPRSDDQNAQNRT